MPKPATRAVRKDFDRFVFSFMSLSFPLRKDRLEPIRAMLRLVGAELPGERLAESSACYPPRNVMLRVSVTPCLFAVLVAAGACSGEERDRGTPCQACSRPGECPGVTCRCPGSSFSQTHQQCSRSGCCVILTCDQVCGTEDAGTFDASMPTVATDFMAVAAGSEHTCAVKTSGGVKCWGASGLGLLGDDFATSGPGPVDVLGLTSGVQDITASPSFTCALTDAGGVQCWGLLPWTGEVEAAPVDVSVSADVRDVVAGGSHACALTAAGGVRCWGDNSHGQLGDGSTSSSAMPVEVAGLDGVVAIAAGGAHTCALTDAGGVECWGQNTHGELGNAAPIGEMVMNSALPVEVAGSSSGVVALGAGERHTCAATAVGGVRCWGSNSEGQLGDGTMNDSSVPLDVTGLASEARAVALGAYYSCALVADGGVRCWGSNYYGMLGADLTMSSLTPVDVIGLDWDAQVLSAGRNHVCALLGSSGIRCWGEGAEGQLGNMSTADSPVPVDVLE